MLLLVLGIAFGIVGVWVIPAAVSYDNKGGIFQYLLQGAFIFLFVVCCGSWLKQKKLI